MLSHTFNSSWKEKIEPNNFFDDNFLNQKNKALEPLQFLFESEDILRQNQNNLSNNKLALKNEKHIERERKKSLKESDLYNSNIIIIESVSEDESEPTTFNKIEKEVKKINILLKNSKKFRRHSSKVQKCHQSN